MINFTFRGSPVPGLTGDAAGPEVGRAVEVPGHVGADDVDVAPVHAEAGPGGAREAEQSPGGDGGLQTCSGSASCIDTLARDNINMF